MLRTSARKPAQLGLLFLLPELKEPSLNRERTPELPMNEPVEFSPSSKSTAPLTASSDFWCRRSTRLLLFFLHLVFLIVAVSFTPGSHAFELGQVAGLILILGCLFSWAVLYHAQSPTLVGIFAGVAIAQIAFIAFVGLQFRFEEKALQAVSADAVRLRQQEAATVAPFSMDPLFEMCSGTRVLSLQELTELRSRGQQGRAKLQELELNHQQWLERTESRLRTAGPATARNFHQGVASTRAESDEIMKSSENFFIQAEHLVAFFSDHQNGYHAFSGGLVSTNPRTSKPSISR